MHGFFFIKNKSSFIVGSFFQIDPIAVCEIEQSLEILEFPFFAELFHVFKNGPEIGPAAPVDTEVLEIILPVFFAGNMCHILYKAVTLDDIEVHFAEKILLVAEDSISFFHKSTDGVC